MKRIITFGTYDLLHIGHINIFKRARKLGDYLIAGVSTDALNLTKKDKKPVYSENDRAEIVKSLRYVDEVFFEESLDLKREYIQKFNADILVMGDDWEGKFDFCKDLCEVVYLDRTPEISTTKLKEDIKKYF
ncbi:MAG: adenylyltransferase/cytidyltransferase family protein [Fibrobacterales bacterium]